MKGVMALFDSELRDEIFFLMSLTGIVNYTHFKGLHGSGNQGKKEGSITWPGSNEIILMILSEEDWEKVKNTVQKYKKDKGGPVGLILFQWGLGEVVF